MPGIYLSEEELEVLADSHLAPAAKLAYVFGIRPFADYSTGIVGDKRRISTQSIREAIEYLPRAGSHEAPYRPSRHQVKRILMQLRGAGLVQPLHKARRNDPMRLLLPALKIRPQEERSRSAQRGAPETNGTTRSDPGQESARSAQRGAPNIRESGNTTAAAAAREIAQEFHEILELPLPSAQHLIRSLLHSYEAADVRAGLVDMAINIERGEQVNKPSAYARACVRKISEQGTTRTSEEIQADTEWKRACRHAKELGLEPFRGAPHETPQEFMARVEQAR